jgi:hypothetical protein
MQVTYPITDPVRTALSRLVQHRTGVTWRLPSDSTSLGFRPRTRFGKAVATAGVCLLVLAYALPAAAFRTAGELPDFAGTERVRWQSPVIRYLLHDSVPPGFTVDRVQDAMVASFWKWSEPTCTQVMFDYQGVTNAPAAPGDGVSTVEFVTGGWLGRGYAVDAAAVTDVQYQRGSDEQWSIVEADLYINADLQTWDISASGDTGVRSLSAMFIHEGGHMLGLLHPCESGGTDGAPDCASDPGYAETAMYPFYSVTLAGLSADDQAGVCFLYPGQKCALTGCIAGEVCTPQGCRAECNGLACAEGEVCGASGCETPASPCGATGCGVPASCDQASDCPPRIGCVLGQCKPGTGALGDPCSAAQDCASGACTSSGYCAEPCVSDAQCGVAAHCETTLEQPACTGGLRAFGAVCEESNQCLGQQCMAGRTPEPVCTRTCGPTLLACPLGWNCESVQGRNLCTPEWLVVEGGGCAVVRHHTPRGASGRAFPAVLFGVAFAALVARRRRSPRTA